jgi:hypothetical protein
LRVVLGDWQQTVWAGYQAAGFKIGAERASSLPIKELCRQHGFSEAS